MVEALYRRPGGFADRAGAPRSIVVGPFMSSAVTSVCSTSTLWTGAGVDGVTPAGASARPSLSRKSRTTPVKSRIASGRTLAARGIDPITSEDHAIRGAAGIQSRGWMTRTTSTS